MKWHCQMPAGQRPEFLVVGGPTASGKSAVALELAKAFSGSIICCDSVQLYRGFDVGSSKPSMDDQRIVPHLLFDEFSWNESCDAAIYASRAKAAIAQVRQDGRMPILVGGTGLYLRALLGESWDDDVPSDAGLRTKLAERESVDLYEDLKNRDRRRAAQLHVNDRFRVIRALEINILTGRTVKEAHTPIQNQARKHLFVFMNPARDDLYRRINARTDVMIAGGLIDEVRKLLSSGVSPECKPMSSIGYKETVMMLRGELPLNHLANEIATATRQYAKRQVTWFKKVVSDAELCHVDDAEELIGILNKEGLLGKLT